MFHNVLMTTLTPLSDTNEIDCWENRPFTKVTSGLQQQLRTNDSNVTRTIKKKNKRIRTSFTTEQLRALERWFSRSKYLDRDHRKELSEVLGLGEKCIKIWFQNRRMKEKKEFSESSSESSSEGNSDPVDSVSPLPMIQIEPSRTQGIPDQFITDDTTKLSYNVTVNEHNAFSNQFPNNQSVADQQYNHLPMRYSLDNDTNAYAAHYYPYFQNEYPILEPNSRYYAYQSQWPEGTYNLSYL